MWDENISRASQTLPCLASEGSTKRGQSSMKEPLKMIPGLEGRMRLLRLQGEGGCLAVVFLCEVVLS